MSLSDWLCEGCGKDLRGADYVIKAPPGGVRGRTERGGVEAPGPKETEFVGEQVFYKECSAKQPA